MAEAKTEKWIADIVGVFTDPLIVYPGGWGENTPEWLKTQITLERLIENVKRSKGEEPTGTDAEACAYLMSASLSFPLSDDWAQIYLYVATQVMRRAKKAEMPSDIAVESISDYQMKKLKDLKAWIYRKRVEHRQKKDQEARKERKEKKEEQLEAIQQKFF